MTFRAAKARSGEKSKAGISPRRRRAFSATGRFRQAATAVAAVLIVVPGTFAVTTVLGGTTPAGATTPTTVTDTFGFNSDALQHFTVPAGVTSLTISALGGQGGWAGADASGNPPAGGYQGEVSGTIPVSPGDYLTIGVGSGADEPFYIACTGGQDASSPIDPNDAVPGENPLTQYDGGMGGAPGPNGCSGYGGAGGAATVIEVGASASAPTSLGRIVAGGGGGDGGSGQYALVRGQIGLASYVAQVTPTPITYGIPAGCAASSDCTSHNTIESPSPLPTDPTQGQAGIAVFTNCGGSTNAQNADQYFNTGAPDTEPGCDGGGGAGGGGGAAGGAAGEDQFGSGSSDEWYGHGGSPGENSTGSFSGLSAIYAYDSDINEGRPTASNAFADPGAAYDGSVTITYSTGVPSTPLSVVGTAGNGSIALAWSPPSNPGSEAISDYIVRYSSDGGTTWTTDDTASTSTSATVSGLTNGTGYIFEVEAVNSVGDGPFSVPTGSLTPSGPPGAPVITSLVPQDGGLQVDFTPPASNAPITGYLYQLNSAGPFLPLAGTASPLTIAGLTDGTSYSVVIEAVNSIGTGGPSNTMSQIPVALPGAPTITSVQVGSSTASIAFTPGSDGGSSITGYRYSTDGGSSWTPASASPISLSGLSSGTSYDFEVEAVNASGDGAAAGTSFTTTAVPSAPVLSAIVSQNQALLVSFTVPASGGSPITDYEWSTDGGSTWYSESTHGTPCQSTSGSTGTCEIATLSADGSTALTNGATYSVELRAVNAVGHGAASDALPGTPYTVPGAPTITTGSSGMVAANQSLTVSFDVPTSDGGSAVTGYQYSTDAGATWQNRSDGAAATATTMTITALSSDGTTALSNGTTYHVEIRAFNAAGDGPGSAVATGIPATVPGQPTISSVTPSDQALEVAFTPGSNGGSAITSYEYSLNGGTWIATGTLSPSFTIPALTNGTGYSVEIRAVNSVGNSPASLPESGTPATVPGQPTITGTQRGNATITVFFTEETTGGSPIVSYQYSTDAGTSWSDASTVASPLVITALSTNGSTAISNGTEYPVEIRAVNGIGDSVASSVVEAAPATVPGAPSVTLTPGDGSLGVAATVSNDGGSPITGIAYSLDGGAFVPTGTTSSTFTIPDLTNGTTYTVSVRADNAIGNGAPSTPESGVPITVPGAPTNVIPTSNTASADVVWTAPVSDGGSAVTTYTATAYTSPAGTTVVGTACTTATRACTVTGLVDGTTYYIGVAAANAAGAGISSSPLQALTPVARPAAPTITSLSPGDSYLSVAFTAGSAGGDPITAYQYSLDGGTTWIDVSGTSSPFTIDGLTDGTSYTITLRAVSDAGVGLASTPETATPYTYPDAPPVSSISANGENGNAVITWAAPASDGGAPISDQTVDGIAESAYTVTAFSLPNLGTQVATCTSPGVLTCTLTGLTNGTTYYVSIQAGNAAGLSPRSSPRVAVTPSIDPGAVSDVTGSAGNGQVALSWTPGSTGESAIINYTIWYSSGGGYTQFANGTSTATTATVTGLTNGTPYTFEVYAVNSNGTGPVSAPSSAVTPATVPDAPTIGTATGSNASANVTWSAPAVDGGAMVTGYTVTATDAANAAHGGQTCTWSSGALSCLVTGLTNGDRYTFSVTAANAAGTGPVSALSNAVTPTTVPDAPSIVSATGGNSSVLVTWTVPVSNGGATVTGYDLYEGTTPGGEAATPVNGSTLITATSYTVTGLTNGTTYYFTVRAVNEVGPSAPSNEASATPTTPSVGGIY
ncbi:MAG: beta strand repeat-containing protein, partial [Acidimicrobiales bacterium]